MFLKIKKSCFFIILFFLLLHPMQINAFIGKVKEGKYPRLANYFLKWSINKEEAKELAKWDLLILDMEVQENSRDNLKKLESIIQI